MKLPFVEILKKWKARPSAAVVAAAPVARIEKPASERFGKTVTPNAARNASPFASSSSSFSLPGSSLPATITVPKKISLGGNDAPIAERTIAFQLADIIPQIPSDLLRGAELDPQQRILLNASEIERGMANGHPTVLLRAVYQQAPEIFKGDVSATDEREVALPVAKVLQQFVGLKVRGDQVRDPAAPQVETPFLQVTREDGERFGTPLPRLESTVAAPEPPAKIQPPAPIRLSVPKMPNDAAKTGPASETPVRRNQPAARSPIALKIPPNGTGGPASERVPASGGPPVLTAGPAPALPKISLKIATPEASVGGKALPLAFFDPANLEARIRLPLRAVLRGIPPFQLDGPIEEVPAAAQIDLPFSIVGPQLSLGRIAISPAQFQAAMPEEHRHFFKYDEGGMPVALPLPEVLQNLPNESLQLRPDQVETVIAESFETPFSQKAAEDAARLKIPAGPIAKVTPPTAATLPAVLISPAEEETLAETVLIPASGIRSPLQVALETDEALDAKSVVAHASRLPGVSACAIVSSDGLSLAGNIPAEYGADALCAIAPTIVRRINDQMIGADFGSLQGITLFCAKTPVSFFVHGNICLAALHSAGEIAAEIRARLGCITEELSRMYAQPA